MWLILCKKTLLHVNYLTRDCLVCLYYMVKNLLDNAIIV